MEHIHTPRLENVRFVDRFASKKAVEGTLHLTATHLIFIENSGNKETWILHNHISSVEKQATCPTGCPLLISCKTFQLITLILPKERDGHQLYNSLLKLSQPDTFDQLYAFLYNPRSSETDRAAGWDVLSAQDDYERMGLPNAAWHCTHVNYKYKVCSTYPEDVYTPVSVSVPILVASAKFRSKNRLPALSQLLANGAALCRCSQPLSGFSARCEEDERLLQAIRLANPNCNYLYVVDTRPKINALANRAAGKGYENEDNYTDVRFRFVGIDNIHVMRSTLQRLLEACQARCLTVSAFLSGLEASGWLRHIKTITDTAVFIARALWEEGASVLVHCSDGWDRTAQVCSLSAVILHPYYRTTRGFMTVIEKEWIKFGHKFAQRADT
uniref:myotubularin-related protein 7-like isoform X1 n=2 Tax=Myxine glutinosa TaxID=7769 RepID=UPI00358F82D2